MHGRRRYDRRKLAVLTPDTKAASVPDHRGVPATATHRNLRTAAQRPQPDKNSECLGGTDEQPRGRKSDRGGTLSGGPLQCTPRAGRYRGDDRPLRSAASRTAHGARNSAGPAPAAVPRAWRADPASAARDRSRGAPVRVLRGARLAARPRPGPPAAVADNAGRHAHPGVRGSDPFASGIGLRRIARLTRGKAAGELRRHLGLRIAPHDRDIEREGECPPGQIGDHHQRGDAVMDEKRKRARENRGP